MMNDVSQEEEELELKLENELYVIADENHNTDKLEVAVKNAIKFKISNGSQYTVDLYRYPDLLKQWIEVYSLNKDTVLNLLQRIIEYNIIDSYEIIKNKILENSELQDIYYLRLRPYLVNDHTLELRSRAKDELRAYDPCLEGEKYPFPHPREEEYFGYRKMWYLIMYGDKTLIRDKILDWGINRFDCTYDAAFDFYLWQEGFFPTIDESDTKNAEMIGTLITEMSNKKKIKFFLRQFF